TFSPTDPGYYYSTGSSDLGPGFVPGPANGTADVNEIRIENIRTTGSNFRDIFGGGENEINFHLGDAKYLTKGQTTSIKLTIDRWAGRKGVWRRPNAVWDEDWNAVERDQHMGIETINSGLSKERTFSGSFTIYRKNTSSGNPGGTTVPTDPTSPPTDPFMHDTSYTLDNFGYSSKRTTYDEVITGSRELNRRIFFAGNAGNVEGNGMLDGVGIRFGGNTRNSGIYYTIKLVAKNYAR
ncbi:hypothetical protein, partial [Spirosoma luteolum]